MRKKVGVFTHCFYSLNSIDIRLVLIIFYNNSAGGWDGAIFANTDNNILTLNSSPFRIIRKGELIINRIHTSYFINILLRLKNLTTGTRLNSTNPESV